MNFVVVVRYMVTCFRIHTVHMYDNIANETDWFLKSFYVCVQYIHGTLLNIIM